MFLAAALSPLGSTMIAVALPSIGRELGVPGGALTQWLVASYLIAGIAVMSACGKLGDLIGHRRSLAVGMTIYGVGSALGGVLATLPSLAFARISMAIGGAMTVPAAMAILRNTAWQHHLLQELADDVGSLNSGGTGVDSTPALVVLVISEFD